MRKARNNSVPMQAHVYGLTIDREPCAPQTKLSITVLRAFHDSTMASLAFLRKGPSPRNAINLPFAGRYFTTSRMTKQNTKPTSSQHINVDELLSKPTWSISSLLPKESDSNSSGDVSSKQLRHLLKLSALPPPKNAEEEAKMLKTLSSQLHFVKEISKADTTGIEPLQSLRDETADGEQSAELGVEALREALDAEEVRGKFHRRIRRRRDDAQAPTDAEDWNVLGSASKRTGRYFVVEGGKG